jgi:hypothetical protein
VISFNRFSSTICFDTRSRTFLFFSHRAALLVCCDERVGALERFFYVLGGIASFVTIIGGVLSVIYLLHDSHDGTGGDGTGGCRELSSSEAVLLQHQIDNLSITLEKNDDSLLNQMNSLSTNIRDLTAELKELTSRYEDLLDQWKTLSSRHADLSNSFASLSSSMVIFKAMQFSLIRMTTSA